MFHIYSKSCISTIIHQQNRNKNKLAIVLTAIGDVQYSIHFQKTVWYVFCWTSEVRIQSRVEPGPEKDLRPAQVTFW